MNYHDILKDLAPCGLSCRKCFAHSDGAIKKLSGDLRDKLGNFDRYAKRFSELLDNPVFDKYPEFKEFLKYLSAGDCTGCRSGGCKYPDCGVVECIKEKNIDFCFECDEFPCNKTNFDSNLEKRWLAMNQQMKEIGIEKYYEEELNKPRYK